MGIVNALGVEQETGIGVEQGNAMGIANAMELVIVKET